MSFISKLFGLGGGSNSLEIKDDKTLAFSKGDSVNIIPAKFMFMVITEEDGNGPTYDTVCELLSSVFPEFPSEKRFNLTVQLGAMVKHTSSAGNKQKEWDALYDNLYSQMSELNVSEESKVFREIYRIIFMFKGDEGMHEVASSMVYRMSKLESFTSLNKSELIKIGEEEKAKSNSDHTGFGTSDNKTSDRGNSNRNQGTEKRSNGRQNESSNDLPDYMQGIKRELDRAKDDCEKLWDKYGPELEKLIQRSDLSNDDKNRLEKDLKHGQHGNFNHIDYEKHKLITLKHSMKLGQNAKSKFKMAEAEVPRKLEHFKVVKNKFDKMYAHFLQKKK